MPVGELIRGQSWNHSAKKGITVRDHKEWVSIDTVGGIIYAVFHFRDGDVIGERGARTEVYGFRTRKNSRKAIRRAQRIFDSIMHARRHGQFFWWARIEGVDWERGL